MEQREHVIERNREMEEIERRGERKHPKHTSRFETFDNKKHIFSYAILTWYLIRNAFKAFYIIHIFIFFCEPHLIDPFSQCESHDIYKIICPKKVGIYTHTKKHTYNFDQKLEERYSQSEKPILSNLQTQSS